MSAVLAGALSDLARLSGYGPWVVIAGVPPQVVACECGAACPAEPAEIARRAGNDGAVALSDANGDRLGWLCPVAVPPSGPTPDSQAAADRLALVVSALLGAERRAAAAEQRALAATRRAEHAESQSLTDPLTRLGNRRAWERALEAEESRCARYGTVASIIMVDLDGFKELNDTRGHLSGDMVLAVTGRVLSLASRQGDLVARLGGDEFALLAPECSPEDLEVLMTRLQEALVAEDISASVGGAVRSDRGLVAAWQEADARMYVAKSGRHRRGRTGS